MGSAWAAPDSLLTDDDLFLVSLRLGNLDLAQDVTAYKTSQGLCLDLGQTVEALEFPIRVDRDSGRADGWFLNETHRFSLDTRARTLIIDGKSQPLGADDIIETPAILCVSMTALKRWFPINFEADLSNALVKLVSREPLPIEIQLERRARQIRLRSEVPMDLSSLPQSKTPYANLRAPAIDATAEFLVQKQTRAASASMAAKYTLIAAGEIARLSSELYLGSDDKGVPKDVRARLYRRAPEGTLLGPLKATEFTLGDISGRSSSLISDAEAGRGASISNVPLDAPQNFDRTTFRGDIPAGWDVELYRNGQLLAFQDTSSNGRYEFRDVSLTFGLNNFQIIAYGPQGQVKRESRSINVGPQAVPPGKLWYAAGAFETNRNLFTLTGDERTGRATGVRSYASAQYGFSQNTSVSLTTESLKVQRVRHTYIEGSVAQTLGPFVTAATATVDTTGGQAFEALAFGSINKIEVSTRHGFFNNYKSERISDSLASRHQIRLYTSPTLFRQPVPITFEAIVDRRRRAADYLDLSNRISFNLQGVLLAHDSRFTTELGTLKSTSPTRWVNSLLWNTGGTDLRFRGEFSYRLQPGLGIERVNIGADWYQSETTEIRSQFDWSPPQKDWRLGLGINRLFNAFTLGARGEIGRGRTFSLGLSFTSGFNFGSSNNLYVSRFRPAQTGEAAIRVFEDLNRNGKMDGDDRPVQGVGFAAQTTATDAVTDSRGEVLLQSLRPFTQQAISLDQSTLPDPSLKPKFLSIALVPRPGLVEKIDFPLYPTGDLDGTITIDRDGRRIAGGGLTVQLVDQTGAVSFSTRADQDGYYVIEGVAFGRYALRLDPKQATNLGINPGIARLVTFGDARPSLSAQDLMLAMADSTMTDQPKLATPVPVWAN
jgi:hypothetical protein